MQAPLIKDPFFSRYRIKNKRIVGQMHYHNEYEFYYLAEGTSTYIIDGEIYPIEKGDFVFVPKNVLHMTDNLSSQKVTERFLFCFDDSIFSDKNRYLLDSLTETRVIHIPSTILPKIENIITKIETEYKQNNKGKDALLDVYILELLVMIYRHRCKKKTKIRESDKIVYDVSDYIILHYAEDLSLKSIRKCVVFILRNLTGISYNGSKVNTVRILSKRFFTDSNPLQGVHIFFYYSNSLRTDI